VDVVTLPDVKMAGLTSHQYYEASATTTAGNFDMTATGGIKKIVFLINDDTTNDLFISFDAVAVGTTITNGQNAIIRLKAGEALNDIPRACTKINFIRSAGTGQIRFMGL
jgi:hypothetical protein